MPAKSPQLGLGLISIGREWGYKKHPVPSDGEAQDFLREAVTAGIKLFDTAPAYGYSEERIGTFLASLPRGAAEELYIATKAGEHWNPVTQALHVDHSYDALAKSIDRSLQRLGRIDLLQLHKTSFATVTETGVRKALEHAKASGVGELGASVTDLETAMLVIEDDRFQAIQFPFHLKNRNMEQVFAAASQAGKRVLVNRPFAMGEFVHENTEGGDLHRRFVDVFRCILERMPDGAILTGTRSAEHLRQNIRAFDEAAQAVAGGPPLLRE